MNSNIYKLQTAEALTSLVFYVTKSDNRDPQLNCRIYGMPAYNELEMKIFAEELNRAVFEACLRRSEKLKKEVKENL